MASTATPYGFRPIGVVGSSAVYTGGAPRAYRMSVDNDVAIYTYGLGVVVAGEPNGADTAPAAGTLSANSPMGIVAGVQYTDPTLKYSLWGQYLPANAITAGYTNVLVYIWDDPNMLFQVQANTSVTKASIGLNAQIVTFTGSTTNGSSTSAIGSIATTNTLPIRIVDLVNGSSLFGGGLSAPGDAYTDCIVKWNLNTHVYSFTTGQ